MVKSRGSLRTNYNYLIIKCQEKNMELDILLVYGRFSVEQG